MRTLGIDYGKRRIGLAIGDTESKLALPLETFLSQGVRKNVDYIAHIIELKDIDTIVLGMPLNMDGTQGRRAKDTLFFGEVLKKALKKEVAYIDERLTSIEANDKLKEARVPVTQRKSIIDQVAAQIILQMYLDKYSIDYLPKN
ncbi:MAG: Holliday junction resolvase RuvX [Firmicutes bacterium]|nr:Holliday junction resolvase RuvX [Bacillota bacterium]MCL1954213.1 Holliday junction resolvase RuvX [Bacillota bacterium]